MRMPAVVPRMDNNAMPSLRDRSQKHADTTCEHDSSILPTAKRPSGPQTTTPTGWFAVG